MNQDKLEDKIEDLELDEMKSSELDELVTQLPTSAMELRRLRKKLRYHLYRLRTEALGGPASAAPTELKKKYEETEGFGEWKNFAETWDVAFEDPYRVVHRDTSEQEEWKALMLAKFPQINHDGSVSYPDLKVKKKVEANRKDRKLKKSKKG